MAELQDKTKAHLRSKVNKMLTDSLKIRVDQETKMGLATWYDFYGVTFIGGRSGEYVARLILASVSDKVGVEIKDREFHHSGNGHFSLAFKAG